jgi:non-ribosomal peptide synthetase component E (peptide arylation enzyme)
MTDSAERAVPGVRNPIPGVVYLSPDRLRLYVDSGELPLSTLPQALAAAFAHHGARIALSTPEGPVSYAQLDDITTRFAGALLQLGLQPLDRVLFQVGNCKELIFAFVGCLRAGLIPVCTLPAHREREIEYLGRHVDARAHIVTGDDSKFDFQAFALKTQKAVPTVQRVISVRGRPRESVLRLEDLVESQSRQSAKQALEHVPRDPFQVGIFQLSGGTTDVPKVIPRMQNDFLLNARLTADWLGYRSNDVMFMPMPMIHNACMVCFWMPALLSGATFSIAADMTPESWGKAMREAPPTWIGLIRALLPRLDALVESKLGSLQSVRSFWCPDAARTVREKYGKPAYAMFGMSEGMNMYTREADPVEIRDWSVGRPLSRFDEVRLVEPGTNREVAAGEIGELTCRGPYTVAGYYNSPERNREAFTSDGFYRTGDLMICSESGGERVYSFAGRTKDVVARGQEKINCEEVEISIATHPAVSGCAVVGMPDPVLGERVCVYVVVRHGHPAPTVQDLSQHMQALGFAKFKWPERVEVIDALPLTKVGKLDKAPLRELIRKRVIETAQDSNARQRGGR